MDRDTIIRLAREAGLRSAVLLHIYDGKVAALTDDELDELQRLQRFAALVAAHERDECAKVCDEYNDGRYANTADLCAAAIRSGGT